MLKIGMPPLLAVLMVLLCQTASADTIQIRPDTLAEVQSTGTVIYESPLGINPVSTFTEPIPNVLRIKTQVDGPGFRQATYTHDMVGGTFDPSNQGAIDDLDFSIDLTFPNLGNIRNALFLGLEQGGETFFYTEVLDYAFGFDPGAGTSAHAAYTRNDLGASDFERFAGTSRGALVAGDNPDFSTGGTNIQFILGTWSGTGSTNLVRYTDLRDVALDINFTPSAAVPLPSAAWLGLGLLGLLGAARRMRRRA